MTARNTFGLLKRLPGRTRRTTAGQRDARKRFSTTLRVEGLEERQMMSGISFWAVPWAILPAGVAADAYEADNTTAQAKAITVNGSAQTHNIHVKGDVDYVKFTLTATSNVVIDTNGSSGDTELTLYNGAGVQIAYNNDYNKKFSRISVGNLTPGTYYARVNENGNNATISSYTLKVTAATVPTGDAYEVDNSMSQAKAITLNGSAQTHSLHVAGDVDWVAFSVTAATNIVVETNGSAGDTELTLYNSAGAQIAYDDDSGNGYFSRIASNLGAGTYYARVNEYGNNAAISSYTIQVTGSTPSSSTSYMLVGAWGGAWSDADKSTTNTEDDNLCWAATTSNMLQWTGWGRAGGMTTADSMFRYFQDHWTDQGGHVYYGADWWFDGTNDMQGASGWAQVDVAGGAFFPSLSIDNYIHYSGQPSESLATVNSYLHSGYAVGLGLSGPGGHAVTCWGYDTVAGNPSAYKGVYISDSDDNQSAAGSDYLKYYSVVQTNSRWYLQNFYGSNSWYISDVTGLDRRPSGTGVSAAPAAVLSGKQPHLVLARYGEVAQAVTADHSARAETAQEKPVDGAAAEAKLALESSPAVAHIGQRPADANPQPAASPIFRPERSEDSGELLEDGPPAHLRLIASDAVFQSYL